MRSTKSGPGRCSDSRGMPLQTCCRRPPASAPSSPMMSVIVESPLGECHVDGECHIIGPRRPAGNGGAGRCAHRTLSSRLALPQRGLRRRETRDRHPGRRARDVVEPGLVAEADRLRLPAVLAADADLRGPAARRGPSRPRAASTARRPRRRAPRTGCRAGCRSRCTAAGTCSRHPRARTRTSPASDRWCRTRRTRRLSARSGGAHAGAHDLDHRAELDVQLHAVARLDVGPHVVHHRLRTRFNSSP